MTFAAVSLALCHARPGVRSAAVVAALTVAACGGKEGNEPNILPSAPGTSTGTMDDDGGPVGDDTPGEETETEGAGSPFPQSYRFECVDIQIVGDGDGEAFQAILLESAWTNDIMMTKLNILLTVLERDDEAGTAKLQISSGVGPSPGDLCSRPDTVSPEYDAVYVPGATDWQDARDEMLCTKDGAGSDGVGTYEFALGPEDVVYVYAEDDDGTTFNCVPGGASPDAVPIRAIEAKVTMGPGEQIGFGNLTGCLSVSEATGLCSCIGICFGDPDPACGDCPAGARPLATLLEGINPSPRCTDLLGEDAFDLQLGMVTDGLGYVPAVCGG